MSDIPQHYEIAGGTWDTDVGFNTTLTNVIGDGCLEFKNAAGSLAGMQYDELFEVQAGNPYSLHALAYSTGTTYSIGLSILWYDATESYLSSSSTYNAPLSTASTWLCIGGVVNAPSGARFGRPYVYKVYPSSAWTFYIDAIEMAAMPIGFSAGRTANQLVGTGSGIVKVQCNVEDYDYGGYYDSSSGYDFTAPSAGLYAIDVTFDVYKTSAPSSGMYMIGYLYINGAFYRRIMRESETTPAVIGSTYYWLRNYSHVVPLSGGDVVDVRFYHNDSGTLSLSLNETTFAIHRVE